jgi:hypothetical protein
VSRRAAAAPAAEGAVATYKALLRDVLTLRPSGTRQRLATALGKNRSFVSQISNPAYPVPIPARHIPKIFEVCHLSPAERSAFLAAWRAAHPGRLLAVADTPRQRVVALSVPDLGPEENARFDAALRAFVARRTAKRLPKPGEQEERP